MTCDGGNTFCIVLECPFNGQSHKTVLGWLRTNFERTTQTEQNNFFSRPPPCVSRKQWRAGEMNTKASGTSESLESLRAASERAQSRELRSLARKSLTLAAMRSRQRCFEVAAAAAAAAHKQKQKRLRRRVDNG